MTVSRKSCHMESESTINWFQVLIIACIESRDRGKCSILKKYINPKLLLSLIYLNKCILLALGMLCLMYLPLLSIHKAKLISNIVRDAYYATTSRYFFSNSLFRILKCARAITAVHHLLY